MPFLRRDSNQALTHEVFGVSHSVLPDSYVDRGELDEEIRRLLARPTHVALRGVSKSGKSWLRQTVLPDAIVIQCRLGKGVLDLYREALGELNIRLEVSSTAQSSLTGTVEATGELGIKLIAKVTGKGALANTDTDSVTSTPVSQDINDLAFVADLLVASGRRLVIEDFHYLSIEERRRFAFDLKALWDFGLFVIVVGVWSEQNMLLHLNPDLTARVHEVAVVWSPGDLTNIFEKGGAALNISFAPDLMARAIADCYENAGILQAIILGTLDRLDIRQGQTAHLVVDDLEGLEYAELVYADQLNPLYQQFAKKVAAGIRTRQNATGIYAHAIAVVLAADDQDLIRGLPIDRIHSEAHAREPRIQKGNLRTVLERIEALQVDDDGRGLVVAYNEANGDVTVVDRQLLLYRKYSTVKWPWEDLIREAQERGETFDSN